MPAPTQRIRESRPVKQPDGYSVIIETRVFDLPAGIALSPWCEAVADDTPPHDWQPEPVSAQEAH